MRTTTRSSSRTGPSRTGRRPPQKKSSAVRGNGHVQSLARALNILNTLSQAAEGMTLTDLAHTVGLPVSTAHRLLTTLEQERFVHFETGQNAWAVGVQAFVVGNAFLRTRDLVTIARPFMRNLMESIGETVNLAVEDEGEAIFLAQAECHQTMRAIVKPGGRARLHCSAVGKALLAGMRSVEVSKILQSSGLQRPAGKTVITPARLRKALDEVRAVGYSIDDEENAIGLRCVAAPIHDEFGRTIAAVSVAGPTARITRERIRGLGASVSSAARQITAELGGAVPSAAE